MNLVKDAIPGRLGLHVPQRDELTERQAWLLDPEMMAFNAGWNLPHPGYDNQTGCIAWPTTEWDSFLASYNDPSQGAYFYLHDQTMGQYVGHVHYRVTPEGEATIGVNVVPDSRGQGLGTEALRLLMAAVWEATTVNTVTNDFEDQRTSAVRLHCTAGFTPGKVSTIAGRQVRQWRISRPA